MSLAKKKLAKIFISENATTPNPNNIKASDVVLTSLDVKEPYPNKPFTISSDAIMRATLAGIESNSDNWIELL